MRLQQEINSLHLLDLRGVPFGPQVGKGWAGVGKGGVRSSGKNHSCNLEQQPAPTGPGCTVRARGGLRLMRRRAWRACASCCFAHTVVSSSRYLPASHYCVTDAGRGAPLSAAALHCGAQHAARGRGGARRRGDRGARAAQQPLAHAPYAGRPGSGAAAGADERDSGGQHHERGVHVTR